VLVVALVKTDRLQQHTLGESYSTNGLGLETYSWNAKDSDQALPNTGILREHAVDPPELLQRVFRTRGVLGRKEADLEGDGAGDGMLAPGRH
jgi:hypothetical protein